MSIKIPETIITYCENKENTEAMDLMFDENGKIRSLLDKKVPSPLKKDKYYKAYLFAEKFKYDMWEFRLKLWRAVWEEFLIKYENIDCCDMDDYGYPFYVEYKIKDQNYRFQVVDLDGEDTELFILATNSDKDGIEKNVISDTEIKNYDNLKNETYTDCEETYTRGKTSIDMKDKTEITDDEIEKLRKDARTILEALNISFSE